MFFVSLAGHFPHFLNAKVVCTVRTGKCNTSDNVSDLYYFAVFCCDYSTFSPCRAGKAKRFSAISCMYFLPAVEELARMISAGYGMIDKMFFSFRACVDKVRKGKWQ